MDNDQMMKRFEELGVQLRPGERAEIERDWTALMNEVKANLHLDPASPQAVALADRWKKMTERTYASYRDRGFEDLWQAVGEKYKENAYADNPHAPGPELFAFIQKVNAARG